MLVKYSLVMLCDLTIHFHLLPWFSYSLVRKTYSYMYQIHYLVTEQCPSLLNNVDEYLVEPFGPTTRFSSEWKVENPIAVLYLNLHSAYQTLDVVAMQAYRDSLYGLTMFLVICLYFVTLLKYVFRQFYDEPWREYDGGAMAQTHFTSHNHSSSVTVRRGILPFSVQTVRIVI